MYNILSKYNFLTILPFTQTYFYRATLPKNLNLSKELIKLNYLKFSPFSHPSVVIKAQDKELMLWFYPNTLQHLIVIPEIYLAYKELKKRDKNAIYIIKDTEVKIIVIKDSILVAAFTLSQFNSSDLTLSMNEYGVFKEVKISLTEYEKLLVSAKKHITIKEYFSFLQVDLEKKDLLKKIVDITAYPLTGLILLAMIVSYLQGVYLKSEIVELKETYKKEKLKNKAIKEDIKKHNKEVKKYKKFIEKELIFIGPIALLESIYTVFKKEKAYIRSISITDNKMVLKINSDENPIIFLNRLNEIKYFKQVIIQDTHKPRRGPKTITYDIDIKLLKDV